MGSCKNLSGSAFRQIPLIDLRNHQMDFVNSLVIRVELNSANFWTQKWKKNPTDSGFYSSVRLQSNSWPCIGWRRTSKYSTRRTRSCFNWISSIDHQTNCQDCAKRTSSLIGEHPTLPPSHWSTSSSMTFLRWYCGNHRMYI